MHGTWRFHSIRISENSTLEIWTRNKDLFCGSCSIDELDECGYSELVDTWDQVTLDGDMHAFNEIIPLEDDRMLNYTNYDKILDLL